MLLLILTPNIQIKDEKVQQLHSVAVGQAPDPYVNGMNVSYFLICHQAFGVLSDVPNSPLFQASGGLSSHHGSSSNHLDELSN